MSRAAELQAASKAKKRSKSAPPFPFNELHRADVSRLGKPPSMRDLDIRQFRNKNLFDKLLKTYLAMSIAADHIHLIAFPDNTYLHAMGLLSGNVPFAAEFDVLTSEELNDVMEYVNHWYRHAHRNCKKSGNHGNFEVFCWRQALCLLLPFVAAGIPTSTLACSANPTRNCCKGKHRCQATNWHGSSRSFSPS
jgi:hypothetical protein